MCLIKGVVPFKGFVRVQTADASITVDNCERVVLKRVCHGNVALDIKQAVYNPKFSHSILSVSKLLDEGCELCPKFAYIKLSTGEILPITRLKNGLFSARFSIAGNGCLQKLLH